MRDDFAVILVAVLAFAAGYWFGSTADQAPLSAAEYRACDPLDILSPAEYRRLCGD